MLSNGVRRFGVEESLVVWDVGGDEGRVVLLLIEEGVERVASSGNGGIGDGGIDGDWFDRGDQILDRGSIALGPGEIGGFGGI